ncbi:MAG: SLC13 family permease, partial [Acidobacteriota bacterium]
MTAQLIVFAVLGACLVLFVLDRWRYDVVALLALTVLAVLGIVPGDQAFAGFGHPAVVTVAAVLVVSRGLAASGFVDLLSRRLRRLGSNPVVLLSALTVVVTVCSAFMNNVGALALLMPVAVRLAQRNGISPSLWLMPIAFGSLLGGMTTLIGTPPNIIIGAYRADALGEPFALFDFAPVGVAVAVIGMIFLVALGWRLIPQREGQGSTSAMFEIDDYTTELVVPEESPFADRPLRVLGAASDVELVVAVIVRGNRRIYAPDGSTAIRAGDSLVMEIEPSNLEELLESTGLRLASDPKLVDGAIDSDDLHLLEAVVMPRSRIQGKTAEGADLRALYGLNLLAVAREGERLHRRLGKIRFQPGDVLLLQSQKDRGPEALADLGCLPLAERPLEILRTRRVALALGIFGLAILTLVTRILPAQVAFTAAALAMVLTGILSLRQAYRAIDWPILVLLGAMIPVGGALESTGGAELIAGALTSIGASLPAPL